MGAVTMAGGEGVKPVVEGVLCMAMVGVEVVCVMVGVVNVVSKAALAMAKEAQ